MFQKEQNSFKYFTKNYIIWHRKTELKNSKWTIDGITLNHITNNPYNTHEKGTIVRRINNKRLDIYTKWSTEQPVEKHYINNNYRP